MEAEDLKIYQEGFHDGATSIAQDLIKHGEEPIGLLERLEYWADKLLSEEKV